MKNGKVNGRQKNGRYRPGENGGAHGVPGRSGRPANSVREAARAAIEKHDLLRVVATIAKSGEKDSDRLTAVKLLLAYGFGQPEQRIEHTGEDGGPIEVIHEARDEFHSRMDRLASRLGTSVGPEGLN